MTLPEYLYHQLGPFMLLLARVGGLFVFAPILSSAMIPMRAKGLLSFMVSLALMPVAGRVAAPAPDVLSLGAAVASEALIGVALGLMAGLPLYAAQMGGQLMDFQVGLGLAAVYNPAVDTESTVLADLVLNLGIATFIALGGLDAVFLGLARTMASTPLGAAGVMASPLDLLVSLVSSGFGLALRVSAPVLGAIMLETVASAVLAKTMPQINILTIGFAIKIVAGLVALIAALSPINAAVSGGITESFESVMSWATGTH